MWCFSDDMDRITIETGMLDILSQTCIKFVPRTHEANFLNIQPKRGWVPFCLSMNYFESKTVIVFIKIMEGKWILCWRKNNELNTTQCFSLSWPHRCWSFLGMTGGSQTLSLQTPACMWSGVASHELMHALSFVHEHSRSDRDTYVTILWDNIMRGQYLVLHPKINTVVSDNARHSLTGSFACNVCLCLGSRSNC